MSPIICQIKAIAGICEEYSTSELLSIRLALADALETVDNHLRWRREVLRERRGSHSEETE